VEYQRNGTVCGVPLPAGLHDGSKLAEPIFTPATKAALGEHDENVDFATVVDTVGAEVAESIRDLTLRVYAVAERIARERGIVLADTKFEFGQRTDGTIVLADEVLTPDSSRFWDAEAWRAGRLDSFDKQFVRNWLLHESGWDRSDNRPPPSLPAEVVAATRGKYIQAYERLTGTPFAAS
jgi:phosphoribosylaminoimidazole-succinocarboxamide synthase